MEEAKETLHTEARRLKDNLENKNLESLNLISELQKFSSKLVQLEEKITEDKENFESTLVSRETQISELTHKVLILFFQIFSIIIKMLYFSVQLWNQKKPKTKRTLSQGWL